jgi:hypothetical protein
MKQIIKRLNEGFFKWGEPALLWVYLTGMAIFYVMMSAHLPTQNGDTIEHVHSSFLLLLGEVPYRDFFQHHNPLMWYLFTPVLKVMAYDSTVVEVVSLISFLVFLKSLVYVYRINVLFLSDKRWGLFAAALLIIPGYKLYALDFRPDNYMVFCLIGGLYYYFLYLKEQACKYLCVAFLWFSVSFLFAQKAIFPLAVLGISGLYFWARGAIKTKDMYKALAVFGVCFAGFLTYLLYYDMLKLYYVSNFTFNLNLAERFELNRVVELPPYIKIAVISGWLGVLNALFSKNRYLNVLCLLFVCEFFQRKFYFSPYSYYYWLLFYLAVMCAMPLLYHLSQRSRLINVAVLCFIGYFSYEGVMYQLWVYANKKSEYLPDYISAHITPCDYVFNGDGAMYNLFGKDPAYYWQLIGQLDVIGEQTGIHDKPDINALIREKKPKFIFGRSYMDKFAAESGREEIVHYVDDALVRQYYQPTSFMDVYQLKDEYDQQECVQNPQTGEWAYSAKVVK